MIPCCCCPHFCPSAVSCWCPTQQREKEQRLHRVVSQMQDLDVALRESFHLTAELQVGNVGTADGVSVLVVHLSRSLCVYLNDHDPHHTHTHCAHSRPLRAPQHEEERHRKRRRQSGGVLRAHLHLHQSRQNHIHPHRHPPRPHFVGALQRSAKALLHPSEFPGWPFFSCCCCSWFFFDVFVHPDAILCPLCLLGGPLPLRLYWFCGSSSGGHLLSLEMNGISFSMSPPCVFLCVLLFFCVCVCLCVLVSKVLFLVHGSAG